MVPVIEVKGAIPVGMGLGIPEWQCFLLALFGSMAVSPLIIFFTRRVLDYMMNSRFRLFRRFGNWQHRRLLRKGGKIEKYRVWFLLVFVAIPLPTTGVWTGSMIAGLFDIRMKTALPVIFIGNCIASFLIWLISVYAPQIFGF